MKKYIILLFLVSGLSMSLTAQEKKYSSKSKRAINFYEQGAQAFEQYRHADAINLFYKAIDVDEEFIEPYLVLAEAAIETNDFARAVWAYEKGLKIDPLFFPIGYKNLADVYHKLGDYESALKNYKIFLSMYNSNSKIIASVKNRVKQTEFALDQVKNPVAFTPQNAGSGLNSRYNEYWPTLSVDEKTMVITRLIPINKEKEAQRGNRHEDFFISHLEDSSWTEAKNAGAPLNTFENEGAQAISADGRIMVFTACNRPDGEGNCDLYISAFDGENWSEPKNMGTPINTSLKETQPTLSPDGKTLFFASNRLGGKGGLDIYKTTRTAGGNWTRPESAGDSINTAKNEQSPFIHPDNQTMYFASEGWMGMGGFDLFITRKKSDGTWQHPKNMGYPINTQNDEFGLIVNARGNRAYYSSDREPERGRDIYWFDLPEEARPVMVSYVKGTVYDKKTKKKLAATLELIELESSETYTLVESDPVTGEFLLSLPSNNDYALNVSRENYLFYSDNFSLKGINDISDPFQMDVPLSPIEVGEIVVLRNIFYETDSYALKKESRTELQKLIHLLNNNPGLKIEIRGHTDNIGSQEYNLDLSQNRAGSVAQYLMENGIEKERITFKGYGEKIPVQPNDTPEGRAQNRRTEFSITESK